MLSNHFINSVIMNYTAKPLPDHFYQFDVLYKIITENDYPFPELFFMENQKNEIIHIIYWPKSKTYWVMMKNAVRSILENKIAKLINSKETDSINIEKITKKLPCSLNYILENFMAASLDTLNQNQILPSSKIFSALEIQKQNITTGYQYMPLFTPQPGQDMPDIKDDRIFTGTCIDQDIVSLCSMVSPSYDTCITIGIGTEDKHRRNGYAVSNITLMAKYIIEKGASVHYACNIRNTASKNTAISTGFSHAARIYKITCCL